MMFQPEPQLSFQVQRPSPVGGLNAKNSLADMPPTDAIVMENFFPTFSGCKVRAGSKKWAECPIVGTVRTLMVWNSTLDDNPVSTYNNKLIAAIETDIYDVTAENDDPVQLIDDATSDEWQWINFSNSAGTFLYAVNGADEPFLYTTSATVTRATDTAGATQITGSGLTSVKDFINICSHKQRIWFVEKESTSGWYLAPNAIYGTATQFDFGPLFQLGGYLKCLATWSLDAGRGLDDHLVAISSRGEVIIYAGIDPSSPDTWALVGVFYIGAPIGNKCYAKLDGDLSIITQFGLVPLSQALSSTQVNANSLAYTDKIQLLISDLVGKNPYDYGWQILLLPKYNMLMLNAPNIDGTIDQYVMNTTLMSWTKFTNYDSFTLANFYDELYFAKGNVVYKGLTGVMDDVGLDGTGGSPRMARAQVAYDYYDDPSTLKHAHFIKPIFKTGAITSYAARCFADFQIVDNSFQPNDLVDNVVVSPWNTSPWDTSPWSQEFIVNQHFEGTDALGYSLSSAFVINTKSYVEWIATAVILQKGGLIG